MLPCPPESGCIPGEEGKGFLNSALHDPTLNEVRFSHWIILTLTHALLLEVVNQGLESATLDEQRCCNTQVAVFADLKTQEGDFEVHCIFWEDNFSTGEALWLKATVDEIFDDKQTYSP